MRWRRRFVVITGLFGALLGCVAPTPDRPDVERMREARSLIDQGTVELRRGELDKAEAAYRVALELTPDSAALDGLGCVAFLRGNAATARTLFERAIELDPRYAQALGNLALLHEAEGNDARAAALYRAALRAEPRNFRARNNYAAFLQRRNDRTLKAETRAELLKAYAVARHPAIAANLVRGIESDRSSP